MMWLSQPAGGSVVSGRAHRQTNLQFRSLPEKDVVSDSVKQTASAEIVEPSIRMFCWPGGLEAVAITSRMQVALVIPDFKMPELDRALPGYASTPNLRRYGTHAE
jgi:CheY-like chemotaxis protein